MTKDTEFVLTIPSMMFTARIYVRCPPRTLLTTFPNEETGDLDAVQFLTPAGIFYLSFEDQGFQIEPLATST